MMNHLRGIVSLSLVLAAAAAAPAGAVEKPSRLAVERAEAQLRRGTVFAASQGPAEVAAPEATPQAVSNASQDDVAALNAAVAEALKPFNDNLTRAEVVFKKAATNGQRVTDLSVTMDYEKLGPKDRVSVNVKELSYSYPDAPNAKPETKVQVSLGFNLLNVLSQEQINALGPQADDLVKQFVEEQSRRYGSAARVEAKVTRKETDAQGNLTAVGLSLSLDIDLAQVSDPKEVLITSVRAEITASLSGVDLSATLTSNPAAKEFESDQTGIKEALEKLLARDPETLGQIASAIKALDAAAAQLAAGRPE